jgi:3-isopropylmalate dehydrogenase
MSHATITVLPGDGVGPEVTEQALQVLHAVEEVYHHTFTIQQGLVGLDAIAAEGVAISDDTFDACAHSDAILFGSVGSLPGGERRSDGVRPEQALFRLRKELDLFANLRPVRPAESLYAASPLKPEYLKGTDMIFVRELSAGIYYGYLESVPGKPSEIRRRGQEVEAIDTLLYTEQEIERVVRAAFEIALDRRRKVTSVDKANLLSSSLLWREVVERVAADYPTVTYEHLLVDACAMRLIMTPSDFDVIVTENLFGDILTDEASVLTGSIGMLPSASLGARHTEAGMFGLYEAIHGAAWDIAGQDKANPIGAVLSAALLLRHSLGLSREASAVEEAVEDVIRAGYRTVDIHDAGCDVVGTQEMGRRIRDSLSQS